MNNQLFSLNNLVGWGIRRSGGPSGLLGEAGCNPRKIPSTASNCSHNDVQSPSTHCGVRGGGGNRGVPGLLIRGGGVLFIITQK